MTGFGLYWVGLANMFGQTCKLSKIRCPRPNLYLYCIYPNKQKCGWRWINAKAVSLRVCNFNLKKKRTMLAPGAARNYCTDFAMRWLFLFCPRTNFIYWHYCSDTSSKVVFGRNRRLIIGAYRDGRFFWFLFVVFSISGDNNLFYYFDFISFLAKLGMCIRFPTICVLFHFHFFFFYNLHLFFFLLVRTINSYTYSAHCSI